jgi:hypothetical protein
MILLQHFCLVESNAVSEQHVGLSNPVKEEAVLLQQINCDASKYRDPHKIKSVVVIVVEDVPVLKVETIEVEEFIAAADKTVDVTAEVVIEGSSVDAINKASIDVVDSLEVLAF